MPDELQPAKNPTKILVVDDDANLCQMLSDILDEYHFKTAVSEDSQSALKVLEEFKPTVALVDFRLGEESGIEVAHALKKIDPDLPVILMTAYPSLDLAVKAIQSDIYDFLAKPVDSTYLLRSVTKAAEKRHLSEENKKLISFLKQSNSELDRLNTMKSKFLSIVTHDLRTPLTSIRGYSEMLKTTDDLSEEDQNRCFSAIDRSIHRMNDLINNLLDMVSIEAGKLRVEKSPIDYVAVCRELEETLAPVAASKKIKLEWQTAPGPIQINGDASRLIQILTNLVSNAFKHVPENGKITVRATLKNKPAPAAQAARAVVLTEVIDNGEGIAPEDQARIFEQFFQVETSATRREGLGLGLAISKEIIKAHQGEIGCSSQGLGKGSTFWFTLPLLS